MPKKKDTKTENSIQEVDLSSIDVSALSLSDLNIELPIPKKSSTKSAKKTKIEKSDDIELDEENLPNLDFNDAFDDDFDDFDLGDVDESELQEIEKSGGAKIPKDFFTDKRRQKNLKKFLDVEVPAEYLEGLSEEMQLLFKKGKLEGKLVYDEVMAALPSDNDIEFMDEVFSRLAKLNIELVDALDQNNLFQNASQKKEEIDLADISDDSIRMYLNEIGRFQLIDADEETRLGRLIQK